MQQEGSQKLKTIVMQNDRIHKQCYSNGCYHTSPCPVKAARTPLYTRTCYNSTKHWVTSSLTMQDCCSALNIDHLWASQDTWVPACFSYKHTPPRRGVTLSMPILLLCTCATSAPSRSSGKLPRLPRLPVPPPAAPSPTATAPPSVGMPGRGDVLPSAAAPPDAFLIGAGAMVGGLGGVMWMSVRRTSPRRHSSTEASRAVQAWAMRMEL